MNSDQPIIKNPDNLIEAVLARPKLLEISAQRRQFSGGTVAVITDFVRNGGSLLTVIDEEKRTPLLPRGINLLLKPFGLEYTGDTPYLHNCGALARAGEIHAADREVPYSGGRAIAGGTPFAWCLDENGEPAEPFAAFVEVPDGGRIIALAEGMAYLGMGTKEGERLTGINNDPRRTTYWGKDTQIFMKEIRAWLISSAN